MTHPEQECPSTNTYTNNSNTTLVDDNLNARQQQSHAKIRHSDQCSLPYSTKNQQWNICKTSFVMVLGIFVLLTFLAVHDELTCQRSSQQKVGTLQGWLKNPLYHLIQ